MGDHRYGQGNHLRDHHQIHLHQQNNQYDLHQNNRVDLYLESPRIQQILLHQKLREDIERSADAQRIRYVDSKLHVRNQQIFAAKQPATADSASNLSEVQVATLNIGLDNNSSSHKQQQASAIPSQLQSTSKIPITSITATTSSTSNSNRKCAGNEFVANRNNCDLNNDQDELSIKLDEINSGKPRMVGENCQACLVKEVREDLMRMNKIVQERNDQIIKLKAKCLRSYFERQMLD